MEEVKKLAYKYCMVPKCKNTVISTPDKVFFRIPRDVKLRKKWCKMMRRDNISPLSVVFCCEDHFNVKEDTVNYIQYQIMKQKEKCNLRLKKGVVPHLFLCQKRNMPPPVERMAVVKRQRLALVNEALTEYAIKSRHILEIGEPPQRSDYEVSPCTSHTNECDINQAGPSTFRIEICDDHQTEPCTSYIDDKLQIKLFASNPTDSTFITSYSSVTSPDYAPSCSSELSSVQDDSEDEKHFKNEICSRILLTAIEKEPEMLLGLP